MKLFFFVAVVCANTFTAQAQIYVASQSSITFFSDAAIEDIKAENSKVESALDLSSGVIEFRITMKDFVFNKSLMRQHFNEKYVHSEKYPHATFQGKIERVSAVPGSYTTAATGKLVLHGVTRELTVPGTVDVQSGQIRILASFPIRLEDYNIPRPQILWQNIAEEVEVKVDITYKPQ